MTRIPHKEFIIDAQPFHLQGDRSSTNVDIERHTGNEVRARHFTAWNAFSTETEAVAHCINFGRQIIDGRIEGCSVTDL